MTDRKLLKQNAREAIRGTRPSPVLVTLAVLLILLVTQALSLSLNGELDAYIAMAQNAARGRFVLVEAEGSAGIFPWLLTIALDLMSMVVSMGYTLYAMRVHRRQSPGFGDVFDAFGMFFRVIVLSIVRSLLVSAASFAYALPAAALGLYIDPILAAVICIPFMAPIFIVMYVYRLADYILLDNPTFPAVQCLGMGRLASRGRRWEMFLLDLSFLGWTLLCVFPPALLWVRPYIAVTYAGYYDAVMPDFMEDLQNRAGQMFTPFRGQGGGSSGGWSVPGERRGGEPQDEGEEDAGGSNNGDNGEE